MFLNGMLRFMLHFAIVLTLKCKNYREIAIENLSEKLEKVRLGLSYNTTKGYVRLGFTQ